MSDSQAQLHFQLFGQVVARGSEGKKLSFSNRKVSLLAALLASQPGELFDRKYVAAQVWSGDNPASSLSSLRTALSTLRSDLRASLGSDELLVADRVSIGFCRDRVRSDVDSFLVAIRSGEVDQIPGQLAPELEGPWAEALRQRLIELQEQIAASAAVSGSAEVSVNAYKLDSDNEAKLRAAMTALIREGRASEAVRSFKEFQRRLKNSLGMSPSETSFLLARQARDIATSPSSLQPSNVPTNLPPLFGRDDWLTLLDRELAPGGSSIHTLTGTGGLGKTRLALEAAQKLKSAFQGRVWVVDLSAITDPDDALTHIALTLTLEPEPTDGGPRVDRLLRGEASLLVLDNLEQVEAGLGSRLGDLAEACPHLKILATSRSPVGVPGEHVHRLDPLPVPKDGDDPLDSPSVRLFVDRARMAAPGYKTNDVSIVGRLVRRLEGLPLAICLAAAKADLFTETELLEQLEDRFLLLETDHPEWPARHRRLWTCIEWSYAMHPETHELLGWLSAFRGGWTAKTAGWASGDRGVASKIQTLARASLIHEVSRQNSVRFDMLDSVREFVQAHLGEDCREEADHRHCDAVIAWVEEAKRLGQSFDSGYMAARREEYENFRAAFQWALKHDAQAALRIANALAYYWYSRDMTKEGREWLRAAIAAAPEQPGEELAMCYRALSTMETGLSEFAEAIRVLNKGLSLLPDDVPRLQRVRYLNSRGNALMRLNEFDKAKASFREGIRWCDELQEEPLKVSLLGNLGFAHYLSGHLKEAETLLSETIQKSFEADNTDWAAHFTHNLGLVYKAQGAFEKAETQFALAREKVREIGADPAERSWLTDAASVVNSLGRSEEAQSLLQEAAAGVLRTKGTEHLGEVVQVASELHESAGDLDEAIGLVAALVRNKCVVQRSLADQAPTQEARLESLRSRTGHSAFQQASKRYRGWSLRDIVEAIAEGE